MNNVQEPLLVRVRENIVDQLYPGETYHNLTNEKKFKACETVLIQVGELYQALNQQVMALLWEAYLTGDWGDQPVPDFIEWALEIAERYWGDHKDYLQKLVFATARVLPTVYAHEKAGEPLSDRDGIPVTVDRLLHEGHATKVVEYSYHIAKQKDPEKWIALLPTTSRTELNRIRRIELDGGDYQPIQAEVVYEGTGYRVSFFVPDDDTLHLLELRTRGYLDFDLPHIA